MDRVDTWGKHTSRLFRDWIKENEGGREDDQMELSCFGIAKHGDGSSGGKEGGGGLSDRNNEQQDNDSRGRARYTRR